MYAEMPRQNADGSANVGMQLWVDLPEKLKKCGPRYRDLRASEIPNIDIDDGKVHIKVISGQSHGVDSVKELAYTPVWILDVEIKPGGRITQNLPEGWNAFAYTLSGSTSFGVGSDKTLVGQFHNVVFEQKGDEIYAEVEETAKESGRFCKSQGFPRLPLACNLSPSTSTKFCKRMAIEDARKGPGDFISDHLDSASVRFFQNTAVAVGSETWTRKRNDGSTFQGKFIWTDTWVKRNNLWQIVQAEDITVPCDAK